jgi:broad specificity phosphatase PhoE
MRGLLCLFLCLVASTGHADEDLWNLLRGGGQVLMIRHATTVPGVGDPGGFRLEACASQRNLSSEGRAEARRLGESLRARKVPLGETLSSPWCRCLDTAELAFGARPAAWTALSNLFGRPGATRAQVQELRGRIGAYRGTRNLVLVTHGSTTSALTGVSPAQAEIVVLTPLGGDRFRVAGRLPPDAP